MADSPPPPPKAGENTIPPDPLAQSGFSQTSRGEPVEEEKETADAQLSRRDSSDGDDIERIVTGTDVGEGVKRNELNRMKSYATATSATSAAPPTLPVQKPWYKQPNPLRWGKVPEIPEERKVSPEYKAGFFGKLAFSWMGPLMTTGYKRPLQFNDIYSVNPDRAVEPLTAKMRESFKRRTANGDKYPLLWAMHETFVWEFWAGGLCQLVATVLQVMSPFVLRYLIQFAADAYIASVSDSPAPSIGSGLGLVFGVTIMQIGQSLCINHFIYRGMVIGGMARASLISLIYEKSMVISGRAKAGGAELPDIPAAKSTEKEAKKEKKRNKKGPMGKKDGVAGDGEGWGNGKIVSTIDGIVFFRTTLTPGSRST